jgi:putative addiction module component (TIGR02574 family)
MSQMITDEVQLSRVQRTEIAARLIGILDEETQVENAWTQEVRRRVRDFRSGKAKTRPIDDVLDEIDELLR